MEHEPTDSPQPGRWKRWIRSLVGGKPFAHTHVVRFDIPLLTEQNKAEYLAIVGLVMEHAFNQQEGCLHFIRELDARETFTYAGASQGEKIPVIEARVILNPDVESEFIQMLHHAMHAMRLDATFTVSLSKPMYRGEGEQEFGRGR